MFITFQPSSGISQVLSICTVFPVFYIYTAKTSFQGLYYRFLKQLCYNKEKEEEEGGLQRSIYNDVKARKETVESQMHFGRTLYLINRGCLIKYEE